MSTSREGLQHGTAAERELLHEGRRGGADRVAISMRVGHDQQDVRDPAVACLQHDPSRLGLQVHQPGLRFDVQDGRPVGSVEESFDPPIPGALVSVAGEWYLSAELEALVQPRPEAIEQANLTKIAQRSRTRIGVDSDVETNGRPEARELIDADVGQGTPLDPAGLRRRHAGGGAYRLERVPRHPPGISELAPDPREVPACQSAASIDRPLAGSHPPSIEIQTYSRLICPVMEGLPEGYHPAMPDIDFAFLADAAETVPGQKFHVLGGGIARIGGRKFPLRHPHLALVIGLQVTAPETEREHEIRFVLLDPDGAEVAGATGSLVARSQRDGRDATLTFSIDLWNLTFPSPGDYSFRLLVNGSERKRLPLLLLRPPAGSDTEDVATGTRPSDA